MQGPGTIGSAHCTFKKASSTLMQRQFNVSKRVDNVCSAAGSNLPLQEPDRNGEGCLCR